MTMGNAVQGTSLRLVAGTTVDIERGWSTPGTQRTALSDDSVAGILERLDNMNEYIRLTWEMQASMEGQARPIYLDLGAMALGRAVPLNSDSQAYENSRVIKAGPGVLHSITGYNSNSGQQFIQVHDSLTLPPNGQPPKVLFIVPGAWNFSYSPSERMAKYFSKGMIVCNSTTGPTLTLGANDVWFNCLYS